VASLIDVHVWRVGDHIFKRANSIPGAENVCPGFAGGRRRSRRRTGGQIATAGVTGGGVQPAIPVQRCTFFTDPMPVIVETADTDILAGAGHKIFPGAIVGRGFVFKGQIPAVCRPGRAADA